MRVIHFSLSILLAGCVLVPPPANLDSGISGIVLAGPTCPVQTQEDECADRPYSATIIVKTADGRFEVTRVTADSDGHFRVPLYPGTYLLDPRPGPNRFPRSSPQTVTVQPGTFTDITIQYDTGIR